MHPQPKPPALEPGDAVMVTSAMDEAEKLQEGHGGWNENMAEVCTDITVILLCKNLKIVLTYVCI